MICKHGRRKTTSKLRCVWFFELISVAQKPWQIERLLPTALRQMLHAVVTALLELPSNFKRNLLLTVLPKACVE